MTNAQLAALKADILADPALNAQPQNSDGAAAIADAYNLPAVPDYYVWRSRSLPPELMTAPFDWARVDNLSVGKARIWEWMTQLGAVDLSQANVRAGVEACFSVEAGDQPNRLAIYTGGSRKATRFEKLFATGTGTLPTHHGVGPSVMAVEGPVSYKTIEEARALP